MRPAALVLGLLLAGCGGGGDAPPPTVTAVAIAVDGSAVTGTLHRLWRDHYDLSYVHASYAAEPGFVSLVQSLQPRSWRCSVGRWEVGYPPPPGGDSLDPGVLRAVEREFYARVVRNTIRHVRGLFAGATDHGVRFVEVGNEPDLGIPYFWTGTCAQFIAMYDAIAGRDPAGTRVVVIVVGDEPASGTETRFEVTLTNLPWGASGSFELRRHRVTGTSGGVALIDTQQLTGDTLTSAVQVAPGGQGLFVWELTRS